MILGDSDVNSDDDSDVDSGIVTTNYVYIIVVLDQKKVLSFYLSPVYSCKENRGCVESNLMFSPYIR